MALDARLLRLYISGGTMHREDQFIPELIVNNGPAALDFYKSVFGAEEVHRIMKPGSEKLVHGELTLDGHKFFVCDEFPPNEGGTCKSPKTLGGTGVRITFLVDDANGVVERAVAAGASVSMPVQDMFWGGRYGKIVDPFGHEWGLNQQVKEQSHEETQIAADDFFAKRK
jgi:PhnB protein